MLLKVSDGVTRIFHTGAPSAGSGLHISDLIGGERPIREVIEVLRERVPHWHYQELPQDGHMFPLTQPDMTNRLISDLMSVKSAALGSVSAA
jgi:hypothetical protein